MKKVAAYARVSTNQKAQCYSFEFQKDYWNRTLSKNPEYEYVGLYADKGISGKYMSRRPQFQAMLVKAREGEIDIIFTKSVQRFARNTEELLKIVRELREKNIAIVFEKENINTLNITSELYLTIAAAIAEDDLTRYSRNVGWTIQKKFEKGENVMGPILYGYYVHNNKTLEVNPEEAKVVKEIYDLFTTGEYAPDKIAKYLNGKGLRSAKGGLWTDSSIRAILRNEKYCGDLLLQKYYLEKGKKHFNKGQKDQYYVDNNHEAIVDKEQWNKAQEILKKRSNEKLIDKEKPTYPFTGMIKCGLCGHSYVHKMNNAGTIFEEPYWGCTNSSRNGIAVCNTTSIKESILIEKFIECYNEFVTNKYTGVEETPLKEKLEKLYKEERELMKLQANGYISNSNYVKEYNGILSQIKELEKKIEEIRMYHVDEKDFQTIDTFDEDILHKFIKKVTVSRWIVAFEFYNEVVIKRSYKNRKSGGKRNGSDSY